MKKPAPRKKPRRKHHRSASLFNFVIGGIHTIAPVYLQPHTVMTEWRLFQIIGPDGRRTRHLVGCANWEGRVSSPLVALDLQTLVARTQSGRIYQLEGQSGRDSDADYVFDRWMSAVGCKAVRDVTAPLVKLRHMRQLDAQDIHATPI